VPGPYKRLGSLLLYLTCFSGAFVVTMMVRAVAHSGPRLPPPRPPPPQPQPIVECRSLAIGDLSDEFVARTPAGSRAALDAFVHARQDDLALIRGALRERLKQRARAVAVCAAANERVPMVEVRYEWTLKAELPQMRAEGFRLESVQGTTDRQRVKRIADCFASAYASPIEATVDGAVRSFRYDGVFPYLGAFRLGQ
jgi:hypothetical protein